MNMYFKHIARRVLLFLSIGISAAAAQTVQLSLPDTSIKQNLVFDLPVYINGVSSLGIVSTQFTLSFNPNALIPQGVITTGSASDGWIPAVNFQAGNIIVVMAGADTLKGNGVLVYVRFKVQRNAPIVADSLMLSGVLLNESIGAQIDNGSFIPMVKPIITINNLPWGIIGGESAVLTAAGEVPPPFKWRMLSDTSIAAIDSTTGLFRAKKSGKAIVAAVDISGFDAIDTVFVYDFRASLPDTSTTYNNFVDVPLSFSNVTGLDILATQFKIEYDTTNIQFTSVIQTGTMSSGMVMEYRDSVGRVSLAFSGVLPLSGSGVFVNLRFAPKGWPAAGSYTLLKLVKVDANESGPTYRYATRDSGSVYVKLNVPPVFTARLVNTTISENQQFEFQLKATDADGDSLFFGLSGAPEGMTFDSIQGFISWTPTFAQSGVYKIYYGVKDPHPNGAVKDSAVITVLNVNRLPQFTNVFDSLTVNENQQLTFDVDAVDPDGDSVFFFLRSSPAGMGIVTATGVLTWQPSFSQSGIYTIGIVVKDSKGDSVRKNVGIKVLNVNHAPVFTNKLTNSTISENQPFIFQLAATDEDGDSLIFGLINAPSGMGFNPKQGSISWTPNFTQAGVYNLHYDVGDYHSDGVVRDSAVITVLNVNRPPVFTTTLPDTSIVANTSLQYQYLGNDPDGLPLQFALMSKPDGASITAAGVLTWTPAPGQAGHNTIIVSISDEALTVLDTAIVTVFASNLPPVFTSVPPDVIIGIDSLFTFQYAASDPDSNRLTFSFLKTRSGAALNAGGLFSWKPLPADLGVDTFIVAVTDGIASVQDTAYITVFGFPFAQISQAQFDFGSLGIGATKTLTASVTNSGYAPLVINSLPSPVANANFVFDSSSIKNILPGASASFTITFAPTTAGAHGVLFSFESNDPLHPFISLAAQGTSVAKSAIKKKILVDRMHNNLAILSDTLMGFGELFSLARQSGISVSFADSGLHPDGFDIVMLNAPSAMYTQDEVARIQNFVTGGGLLIATGQGNSTVNTVLNSVLQDTAWSTGLFMNSQSVSDSVNNYYGDAANLLLTAFADTNHPYLTGVDTLVLFNSASISVTGSAIPFLRTSPFGRATNVADSIQPVVIGLSKIGKGKILAIGSTDAWATNPFSALSPEPLGIFAEDNLQFAMNVFSITEDYEVKMPNPTPNETYQLVSIPFDLQHAEIATVLQGLGGVNPLVWRLFGRYDPAAGAYSEFPSDNFNTFRRGEAYWLITRGQFNLNFGNATVLPAQDFFPVKIGPGYSMIGNPFPYKVSWANSLKGDSVQSKLYKFSPAVNDFVAETQTLDPFTGYFVKNLSQDSVTIYINPLDVSSLAKQENAALLNEGEWEISIGASSGKAKDSENYAGVSRFANVELDKLDAAEPPTTPTDYVSVRFTNPSWKQHGGSYAVDIRPITEEGIFWDLDVTTAKKQSKVSLSLSSLGNLPGDFIVYLVDKKTERAERIDHSSTYDFTMGKNESRREFRLVAGKKEFVESNTGGIPLTPKNFVLDQNYPNPFNPSTTIRYSIGHSGDVAVTIYNLLGQKVRTLMNGFHPIGTYDVEWDAKDDKGVTASTGVYFYRITVISQGERFFSETKKMVLMK